MGASKPFFGLFENTAYSTDSPVTARDSEIDRLTSFDASWIAGEMSKARDTDAV